MLKENLPSEALGGMKVENEGGGGRPVAEAATDEGGLASGLSRGGECTGLQRVAKLFDASRSSTEGCLFGLGSLRTIT